MIMLIIAFIVAKYNLWQLTSAQHHHEQADGNRT